MFFGRLNHSEETITYRKIWSDIGPAIAATAAAATESPHAGDRAPVIVRAAEAPIESQRMSRATEPRGQPAEEAVLGTRGAIASLSAYRQRVRASSTENTRGFTVRPPPFR